MILNLQEKELLNYHQMVLVFEGLNFLKKSKSSEKETQLLV